MKKQTICLLTIVYWQCRFVFSGWPEGTYGLPRPKSGCPVDSSFQWQQGMREHKTEPSSYSSTPNSLSGSNSNKSESVVQEFCMKVNPASDGLHKFMPGKYCLLKKGKCPLYFKEGQIYWDDGSPLFAATTQSKSGVLPDGVYNRNTQIEYCCRTEGHPYNPIDLPSDQPFYFLKYGEICQQVNKMVVREDWIHWADEKFFNSNRQLGVHPKVMRSNQPHPFTRLFYCYYEPSDLHYPSHFASHSEINSHFSFGLQTFLTILYVTGAIVGIIFMLAILLAGCQRIFRKHRRCWTGSGDCSNSLESSHLNRNLSYPKTTGTSSPAVSSLSPPPYQQLPMGPLMLRGIRDQRMSEDSLVMCEDGEPPPPYEDVLREQQMIDQQTRNAAQ